MAKSRLISFRLPPELEEAIKEEAEARGRPWQTVMKELISESLGLTDTAEVTIKPALRLHAASKRLRKPK